MLVVVAVVFTATLGLVVVLGLQSASVRSALLRWVGTAVAESTGIHFTARDFGISLLEGRVELEEVELRALDPTSHPFLMVPVIEAELEWRSLFSDRPQILSVSAERPRLDLGAPFPSPPSSEPTETGDLFPDLDLHRFEIIQGEVLSGEAMENLDLWFDTWRVESANLIGSLVSDQLGVTVAGTRLAIEGHRRPEIQVDVSSRFLVSGDGILTVEAIEMAGEGVKLQAEGRGQLEPFSLSPMKIELEADLARLIPDLTTSGRLEANADLIFASAPAPALTGRVQIDGENFPAELLQPVVDSLGREGFRLAGTQLDLEAVLDAAIDLETFEAAPGPGFVEGEARLTWRRGQEPLVVAAVQTPDSKRSGSRQGIDLAVAVEILPRAPGSRRLRGRVAAPGWNTLSELELDDLGLEIRQDDVAALARELGLTTAAFGGFQPAGSVSLVASASGPIRRPTIEGEAKWDLAGQRVVELAASSTALSRLDFRGDWLPESAGVRRLEGTWLFPHLGSSREGAFEKLELELVLPDLGATLATTEDLLAILLPDPERRQAGLAALTPEVRPWVRGSLEARLHAAGPLRWPTAELAAEWAPSAPERLVLAARFDGKTLDVSELAGEIGGLLPRDEPLRFRASGQADVESPLRIAELDLEIFDPIPEIRRLDVRAVLEDGPLALEIGTPSVPGRITAKIPLAVLSDLLPDSELLARAPLRFDAGPIELEIEELGLGPASEVLFDLTGIETSALEMLGDLDARLSLNPGRPVEANGDLRIRGLDVGLGENRLRAASDLRIDLAQGRLSLAPANLEIIGPRTRAPLDLRLSAEMDRDWRPELGIDSLIRDLELALRGEVDSSILTPYLAGGVASGAVAFDARVEGPLGNLHAELRVRGPEASLVLPGRYRTRISEPELRFTYGPEGLEIREGRMLLNRGEVVLSGILDEDKVVRLGAEFEGVRYRLDHGLTVSADGNLALVWPPEGRRRLSGTIDVERGSLRRNIQLERELIRMVQTGDLVPRGSAFLETFDLDLQLLTREGVRIKNNLADLRADWDSLRVRGTLASPTISGTIAVDPGGFLTAYGQTVRIDQGSLIFSGVPGEPPRLDFETTTSAEDPRLRSQWDSVWSTGPDTRGPGGGFWDRYDPQAGTSVFQVDELTTGLTSYFQNRFLQSITGGAPLVELSVQPLPLMGETDTTARVTMSYFLTPQISYVLSQNPREAEGRTDILNLYNFAVAPSLRAQIFRNDQANQGLTLQQMLELGGGRRSGDTLPRLASIDLSAPDEIGKRRVRRATGLRRGHPVDKGANFDIEIDMLDALARAGSPAAEVAVDVEPVPKNRVTVRIEIDPGPQVDFEFTGDRPHRQARQDIRALYQPTGIEDSPALETVRQEAVRALRARGFLDPQVEVTTVLAEPEDLAGDRRIEVHADGGRQINPRQLAIEGVPENVGQELNSVFTSRLSRVELAVGEPAADELFRQSMESVGYPEPEILSRTLSDDGTALTVVVEPGRLRRLATIEILGVEPELVAELDQLQELRPGDPVRTGEIARSSLVMEDHLREQGFADAAVATRLELAASGDKSEVALFYEVEVGPEHRIGELRTEGLSNSSPGWVKRVSQLETGELLTPSSITAARRKLARTGVFQRIALRREQPVEKAGGSVFTPITFDLEEHRRYRVSYGLRAESTREAGVVADVSDLNFLGRGQTLGLRLVYGTLDRSARLYWSIPRIRQTNKNLEFFLESRREEQPGLGHVGETGVEVPDPQPSSEGVVADIQEAWAQLTFPWGRRAVHRFYTVYKRSATRNTGDPAEEESRVVSPFSGWQVSFDTGERSFFETSTDRNTVFLGSDLSFSSESLGSDYTGYGWFGQVKPQIPLVKVGNSALVWVHNYRIGLREARDDAELPFFDRLFAGGEFSVRGYPTNSLGPVTEEGIPLGGEALFVTNQELRFPIWTLLSGVAFFDAGNVWASRGDVESTLFKSVGAGLRADSPIGPLRLDLALPLDRRDSDPEYKIYFGLGQTF